MRPNSSELRSSLRRHSVQLYFLTVRQGARRFLDLFRFGEGKAERLAAAVVLGSLFFLVIFAVGMAGKAPLGYGLGIAGGALVVAWVTSAAFVLGPPDDALAERVDRVRAELLDRRTELREVEAEEAEDAEAGRRAADRRASRPVHCPYCDGLVPARALKCRHCGEYLDEGLREERERAGRRQTFFPGAAILSWFCPGLGQLVKGQAGRGFLFFGAVVVGLLCCGIPGVVIHVVNIFDAAVYAE